MLHVGYLWGMITGRSPITGNARCIRSKAVLAMKAAAMTARKMGVMNDIRGRFMSWADYRQPGGHSQVENEPGAQLGAWL